MLDPPLFRGRAGNGPRPMQRCKARICWLSSLNDRRLLVARMRPTQRASGCLPSVEKRTHPLAWRQPNLSPSGNRSQFWISPATIPVAAASIRPLQP
jgi:hypothetical protein